MTNKTVYPWLDRIDMALAEMDSIPLLRTRSEFDLKALSHLLAEKFEIENLELTTSQSRWLSGDEITKGLGEELETFSFSISPIMGDVFWMMNHEDIEKLTTWLLTKNTEHKGFSSEILQEGYYQYLILEMLDLLKSLPLFQSLSPKINPSSPFKDYGAYGMDIGISFNGNSLWGRLLLSQDFRKNWEQYFSQAIPHPFQPEIAKKIDLPLSLIIGRVNVDQKTLNSLSEGDFLLLDSASYDVRTQTGSGLLALNTHPLMHFSLKQNQFTIVEEANYQEENMEPNHPFSPNPNNQPDDSLPPPQEPMSDDMVPEEPLSPPPEEESLQEESAQEEKLAEDQESNVDIKDLPVSITVEISRIRMSLNKLMQLEPGNLLELPVSPNHAVTLSVQGKKLGKAELVYLGEALGIRILEIGK